MGPSAALTPAIWDKTIPYDGENFHLEYMDLEEFLMENGIAELDGGSQQKKALKDEATGAAKGPSAPVSLLPIVDLDQCEEEVVTTTSSQLDVVSEICEGRRDVESDL